MLLRLNTWYRSREGQHGTKQIKELDVLGNLGQVSLPPCASTCLLTLQKPLLVGLSPLCLYSTYDYRVPTWLCLAGRDCIAS